MPNRSTDALFQLIQSLERSEKRNFKLYITRNSGPGDLKVVQLFDTLDKMKLYDERTVISPFYPKTAALKSESTFIQGDLASLRLLNRGREY